MYFERGDLVKCSSSFTVYSDGDAKYRSCQIKKDEFCIVLCSNEHEVYFLRKNQIVKIVRPVLYFKVVSFFSVAEDV